MKKVMTTLRNARHLIAREDNWTKGAMRSVNGSERFCLVGAVCYVCDNDPRQTMTKDVVEAMHALYRCLQERDKLLSISMTGALISYNDAPARTHEDVLALLDETMTKVAQ